ncbi:hypothetical protein Bhyg_02836 [Pseudolycoriella hygida]|uniref:Uncharacterized protein n=1 Tax=Pseudolycoriella hygida TaxID=35572 RepID=A0A9Q0NC66_9DIPT|nr:hypothetical protein Bhyg_02836 [Pseudolycoriella hygida]
MIKIIAPKQARNSNHVNYIVYFKKGEEPYRIQRTGPTQCSRCQRPSHGARHCLTKCPRFTETQKKAEEVSAKGGTSIDLAVAAKCCRSSWSLRF